MTAPTTMVTIQDLLDAIRAEEQSVRGMVFNKIADAGGKEPRGNGIYRGIVVTLLENWQLEPYPGDYTLVIDGGDLVQLVIGDPVASVTGGPQVELNQSVASTIVTVSSGSGLSTEQDERLTRIEQLLRNKFLTDPATGKAQIYNDAGNAVLFEADIFEDVDGTQLYRGQGAERRDRYEE